jgi:ABC-type branched-subunit amino acid transport system ATPase component
MHVLAGLLLPRRGGVRLGGRDVTYADAERRAGMGIVHVSGGHGIFGGLTVAENLQVYAHSLDADRARTQAAIDRGLEAFPELAGRLGDRAALLSGGQRQMLGLTRALILEPKVLLVDELSLGLAPAVVARLVEQLRAINATGTSVVLIEQSANLALSVVEHAYFMERGQIAFDGPAAELRARDDLLRAVFLQGAEKAGAK